MHVIQLFVLISGEMRLHLWNKCRFPLRGEFEREGEFIVELATGRAFLVPPDYPLQLEGKGHLAIFFLNPEMTDEEDGPPTHQVRCHLVELLPESTKQILPRLDRYLNNGYTEKEMSCLCTEIVELIISMGQREGLYWLVQRTLKCLFDAFENDAASNITTIRKCIALLGDPPNETQIQREFGKNVGIAIR
jgi:hypothetical protein